LQRPRKSGSNGQATSGCYDEAVSLPFDTKRIRAYELEFGAGGQRLGCKFLLDDGSLLFVGESEITSEIEGLMASLGSPTQGLTQGGNLSAVQHQGDQDAEQP